VQLGVVTDFEELYNPIIGATSDGHGHVAMITPQAQMDRTCRLRRAYTGLKAELLEEVKMMETRIIRPATDAKEYIQPLKKTIKKRENKRLDYERHFGRVTSAAKKPKRSEREDASLVKAEVDLSKATDVSWRGPRNQGNLLTFVQDFKVADAHLRKTLPPVVAAIFAILPHLLAAQILIQNSLLAQYYTTLHNYCQDEGFPSPSPPMEHVIAQWSTDFRLIQKEVESINTIARGKTVHTSMQLGNDPNSQKSISGFSIRNNVSSVIPSRRISGQGTTPSLESPGMRTDTRLKRIVSSSSTPSIVSLQDYDDVEQETESRSDSYLSPGYTPRINHSPDGQTRDYFAINRKISGGDLSDASSPGSSTFMGKKKPPPPPPKRIPSNKPEMWVTALYEFEGQESGDLSFSEGDRIKVTKKTGSQNDWWEGELRGHKGKFPANYCEVRWYPLSIK
jgi:amphiphysin